ncbi:MAG: hypothetical protein P8J68_00805 [Arenicellaceae bacterium]|nr:hypothetical protein [Arenicellaceae bacterium]
MDIVRTIHLDMVEHPADIVPSRAGYSIGKWEGNTLVIDTVDFLPGWLEATCAGVRHGANMHTIERHTLSEDGQSLALSYTINDPDYLAEPSTREAIVVRTPAAYDLYHCENLTEEITEGF